MTVQGAIRGTSLAAMHVAAGACLMCLALVCYGVAMRYFAGVPQAWVETVAGWLVVAMVMGAAPEAQLRGEHVGVDTLTERARGRSRRALVAFGLLWVAATAAVMIWEGWAAAAFSRMTGMMTELGAVRLWWIQLLVPAGFVLMLIVALAELARVARGLDGGDSEAEEEAARLKASPLE
jgi:TRAP-type C4-dicarboxylate transport system permease small subunit